MLAVKWYGIRLEGLDGTVEGDTRNAFQSFTITDLVLLLAALAAIALPLWTAAGRQALSKFAPGAVVAALGLLAVGLIAFRLISLPNWTVGLNGAAAHVNDFPGAEVTRRIGAWLGLATAAMVAYAGCLSMRARASLNPRPARS
jgi:hypothetical protein